MTASNVATPVPAHMLEAPILPINDTVWEYRHVDHYPNAERLNALNAKYLGQSVVRAACYKPPGLRPKSVKIKKKVPRIVPHAKAVKLFKREKWGRCKACKLMHLEPNQYGAVEVDEAEYYHSVKPQLYKETQLYYFNRRLDLF